MLEVILDTETTGLSIAEKHRIVEIGCVELNNQIPTNKIFHKYINPERPVSEDAYKVHGYSNEFLSNQKTFSEIPLDKILIETDSPFLAPEPMRGKKNEPSFIKFTLEKLAEIKKIKLSEADKITSKNFNNLFFNNAS